MLVGRRLAPILLGRCSPWGRGLPGPILANPRRSRVQRPATPRRVPRRRSPADRPAGRRRPARPADRVVVLHRPPARRGRASLSASSSSSSGPSGAPSRSAGRRTWRSPTRAAGAFHYDQRTEIGPQVDASPTVSSGPKSFVPGDLGHGPGAPSGGRTPWVMRGYEGRDRRCGPASRPAEARGRLSGGLGPRRSSSARRAGRSFTTTTAGSTSGRPAAPTTTRGRAMAAAGHADRRRATARRSAGRPGSTTSGATSSRSAAAAGTGSRSTSTTARTSRSRSSDRSDGSYPLVYGTLVDRDGRPRHLDRSAFTVDGDWDAGRSPTTGAVYPAGWRIEIPGERLRIDLTPTVADQELDTRATTGVVYWEGSQGASGEPRRRVARRRGLRRADRLRTALGRARCRRILIRLAAASGAIGFRVEAIDARSLTIRLATACTSPSP